MAAKFSRHIALTGPLADYVEAEIAKGEYASASEMMRTGLRLLKEPNDTKVAARSEVDPRTKKQRPS